MIQMSPGAIVLCLGVWLTISYPPPAQETARLADRLNIAQFSFWYPDTDTPGINRERVRLDALCETPASGPGCRRAHFKPAADRVAVLHGAPDPHARVVGYVYAVLEMSSDSDEPDLVLEFQSADTPRRIRWLPAGDIGYGANYEGVRFRGPWIELIGAPFKPGTWINGTTEKLRGEAESIRARLLQLPSMRGQNRRGRVARLPAGVYFIERIERDSVTLRESVDADMLCGGDETPPKVMPPSYRVPAAEFFQTDGLPRFEMAYPKGC